jgi:probable HAF family extracellular repeat protein
VEREFWVYLHAFFFAQNEAGNGDLKSEWVFSALEFLIGKLLQKVWCNMRKVLFLLSLWGLAEVNAAGFQGVGGITGWQPYPIISQAFDVSDDGRTVVGQAYTVSGNQAFVQAFRWTSSSGGQGLGDLPGGGFGSYAYGVSSDGSVVVGEGWSGMYNSAEAFRWENGVMNGLGYIAGASLSRAHGISGDGAVIVGQSGTQAFRYANGTMNGLGLLPDYTSNRAFGVSSDGHFIVGDVGNSSAGQACRWSDEGGAVGLGFLPGGITSRANKVSLDGSVVVGVAGKTNDIYGSHEAFRWENGLMIGLGDLPGGDFYSWANDVSGNGAVVVGYSIASGRWSYSDQVNEAFIWDSKHGMRNLKTVLVNDFGLNLMGWTLSSAEGISSDGLTIVGNGINPDGYIEGWVVTIPEPTVVVLLISGCLIFLRRKR